MAKDIFGQHVIKDLDIEINTDNMTKLNLKSCNSLKSLNVNLTMAKKSNILSTIKKARKEMSEPVAQSYVQYHILKGNGVNPVRCQILGYSQIETIDNDDAINYFNLKTEL